MKLYNEYNNPEYPEFVTEGFNAAKFAEFLKNLEITVDERFVKEQDELHRQAKAQEKASGAYGSSRERLDSLLLEWYLTDKYPALKPSHIAHDLNVRGRKVDLKEIRPGSKNFTLTYNASKLDWIRDAVKRNLLHDYVFYTANQSRTSGTTFKIGDKVRYRYLGTFTAEYAIKNARTSQYNKGVFVPIPF